MAKMLGWQKILGWGSTNDLEWDVKKFFKGRVSKNLGGGMVYTFFKSEVAKYHLVDKVVNIFLGWSCANKNFWVRG